MAGLLTANGGEVFIEGNTPGEQTKAIVSYLPERPYFNSWMRVDECLDYFQDFCADFDRTLAEKMLADLGVPTDKKLKALSKGTKERYSWCWLCPVMRACICWTNPSQASIPWRASTFSAPSFLRTTKRRP
jgi:ABC-type transport system involved in cytochrome c biogenesis ATPase subunit